MSVADKALVEAVVRQVLRERQPSEKKPIPVGVSMRHAHLCREHMDILFGKESELKPIRPLMGGQFAAEQRITIVSPAMCAIENVRLLGPLRSQTQVEISRTDAFALKMQVPVRPSGDIPGTPGLTLIGPAGCIKLEKGCIIANRHVHMSPEDAGRFGVFDGETVACYMEGERPALLYGVQVRVDASFTLEMHIDADDANAVGLVCGQTVSLRKSE